MNTWRAKRYSVSWKTVSRRRRINITVRRFRLGRRPTKHYRLLINLGFRGVRQLDVAFLPSARLKPSEYRRRLRLALSSGIMLIGLIGVLFSLLSLISPQRLEPAKVFASPSQSAVQAEKPVSKPIGMAKSIPTHISIASQEIETDLIPVGLNPDGSIETPPVLEWLAGWYEYSPTPGEIGPAVIVGHVDSYQDVSVFWRLRYVQPADSIVVSREDGTTARFTVTGIEQYDQNDFPTDTVYGNTSEPELRVITCGGTFDTATGHYTENTVVFAKLVSSP